MASNYRSMDTNKHLPSPRSWQQEPIFVIGNPRSGTTLLRLMLTCHPGLCIPPECGFAMWLEDKYHNWGKAQQDWSLEQFINDLTNCRKFNTWSVDIEQLSDFLQQCDPHSYSGLVASVYHFYCMQSGKPDARWGDKNNYYLQHIPEIHALFPQALFLHIVRDARDVACSYKDLSKQNIESRFAPQLPRLCSEIAVQWNSNLHTIRSAFQELPSHRFLEIRYEDLLTDTSATLERICRFLDEPYSAEMLEFYRLNAKHALEPREFLKWKLKTVKPLDRSRVGRYKKELTNKEKDVIAAIASQLLEYYGYEI